MSNAIAERNGSARALEQVMIQGDLSSLNDEQRVKYYLHVCDSIGLNPATRPLEYIKLNNRLVLYARKDCTEQLRKMHGVSIVGLHREVVEGVYVVTASAKDKDGRTDESIGAVPIEGIKGEPRANAMMKAETKAKRRVTLSICGLGMLDETEIESSGYAPTSQDIREHKRQTTLPASASAPPPVEGEVVDDPPADPNLPDGKGEAWEPPTPMHQELRDKIAECLKQLNRSWNASTKVLAEKTIGRPIATGEKLEHLTEEEGKKLLMRLLKAIETAAVAAA